jgi:hypothetical protein
MVTLSTSEPQLRLALNSTETALRRLANYELDPPLAGRLEFLSERKEFLNEEEHAELLALVGFARRRTIEKLEARLALKQLHEIVPEMVSAP